jgi:membrane protease YdiL (CAAX protease family)
MQGSYRSAPPPPPSPGVPIRQAQGRPGEGVKACALANASAEPAQVGPATPAPTTQPSASALAFGFFVLWLIVSLLVSKITRVFDRRSIAGPDRLGHEVSVWWLLGAQLGAYVIGVLAGAGLYKQVKADDDVKELILTAVVAAVAVPALVAGVSALGGKRLVTLGLSPRRLPRGLAAGLLCAFILYPMVMAMSEVTTIVMNWLHLPEPKAHEILQNLANWHDPRLITLALVVAIVVAPVFEEIAFRGVLQTCLVRLFSWMLAQSEPAPAPPPVPIPSPATIDAGETAVLAYESPPVVAAPVRTQSPAARWAAVLFTAAVFAGVHRVPAFFPPLFVLAVGLGYAYERTGNLWVSMTTHALFNTLQIVLFLTWGTG